MVVMDVLDIDDAVFSQQPGAYRQLARWMFRLASRSRNLSALLFINVFLIVSREEVGVSDTNFFTIGLHTAQFLLSTHYGLRGHATNVFAVESDTLLSHLAQTPPSRNKTDQLVLFYF